MKNGLIVCALALSMAAALDTSAQSIGLASLFKPGARAGVQYYPEVALSDTSALNMSFANVSLIVPLKGSVGIDFKKLKANASQMFWTVGAGVRQFQQTDLEARYLYSFNTGITGVRAATGEGVWAYTANLGAIQDPGVRGSIQPFFTGGVIRIKIKGIHRQNFYGLGVAYNGRTFLPVPIWGMRRKITKGMHLSFMLPVQADLTWKLSKAVELNIWNRWASFRSTILAQSTDSGVKQDLVVGYRSLQSSLVAQFRISSRIKVIAEGGYAYLRALSYETTGKTDLDRFVPDAGAYARISARFNFGDSPLASQLFGNDL